MSDQLVERLISGAIAGVIGTITIYPIDSIKTRIQSGLYPRSPGIVPHGIQCVQAVWRKEGLGALYRGLSANLVGVTPEKAIKLAVNDWLRVKFARHLAISNETRLPPLYGMLAGAIAGLCQVVATNPMEITKIQMQLNHQQACNPIPRGAYPSSAGEKTTMISVARRLGLRGLYRGTTATLARDIPFSIIFFQSFAILKVYFASKENYDLSVIAVFKAGMLAGALASIAVTPMDVVKTRLQSPSVLASKSPPPSMIEVYRNIWREAGLGGFVRGASQRAMTSAPLFGISLLAYELQKLYFTPKTSQ